MKRVLSWLFVVALIASLAISVSATTANPFVDVPSDRFEDAVLWAYYSGITTGTGDGTTFSPENACTRKQIVTFLWRAAGEPEPQSMENPFVDVPADRFEKAILWAYYEGITTGTGDGTTFSPNNPCTRKQIVTFLWRYNGEPAPESTEITFTDVKNDRFAPAILWAAEQNITTGTGDGTTFSPENPCTRKQIVTFLWRAAGEPAVPGTEGNPITIIPEEIPYTYEVSVAAGETVYYCGHFNGMILDINADNVSVNGVDAAEGYLTMELTADNPRFPVNLAITNNGEEDAVYELQLSYPIGTQMNPETLFNVATVNVNLAENNNQGYYYSWYSRGEGTLTLTCPTVDGVEYDVILTNMSNYAMAWLSESEDGTVSIDVVPGDEVVIQVATIPDMETWIYPALETVITGELVYPVGSQMNPEVITDISAIDVNVAEGNSQGYYYSWKSLGDGTLTLTAPAVEGVEYDVVLTNMSSWAMSWLSDSEDGTVSIAVEGGDEVIIQVATYPDAQWVYPALETVLTGEAAVVAPTDPAKIVAAAYALPEGGVLPYEATLTGEIISIDTPYSTQFYNITVTIQVEGCEEYPIQCFRMKGEGADALVVGDTITVTGTIKNYYGTIEFDAGCTLDAVVKGEVTVPEDPAQIVADAYALADGEVLPYVPTLTGEITSIKTAYNPSYDNISVVIAVEGCEDYPILCYRLKGEGCADLAVGDIITVTGTVKNYGGTIEFDAGCTLDAVVKGGNETPVAPEDPSEILMAAYKLAEGESLPYNATLTGEILSIKEAYSEQFGNISVVIAIDGWGEYPILCYRMKGTGADTLAVGDTVTVTGTLMNYKGTVEFGSGCSLDAVEKRWEADINNHWHEGGADLGEHTLGEDNYCTVCGAEVNSFFGETYVQFYDVNYNTTMCLTYDENGTLVSDERWIYTFDSNGCLDKIEYYLNSELTYVEEILITANGAVCTEKYTEYLEDGSVFVSMATYDDNGYILSQKDYEDDDLVAEFEYMVIENKGSLPLSMIFYQDGNVSAGTYEYDEQGNPVSTTETLNGEPVRIYEYALTADGYYSVIRMTTYTEEGSVEVYETDFDVNGNTLFDKYYVDGILVQHSVYEYALDSWGWYYMCKETIYYPEGNYTVNEYNENWELVSSQSYDANGNLIG